MTHLLYISAIILVAFGAHALGCINGFRTGHAAGWVDRQIEDGKKDKARRDSLGRYTEKKANGRTVL